MSTRRRHLTAAAALFALSAGLFCAHAQHIETSTFNQAPLRPKEDPKMVAHGKTVYDAKCASCHGADMRGAANGPNILRSQWSLTDKHGELLRAVMQGKNADVPDHAIDISDNDANDVAAYVRSLVAQIGSQGRPPGESSRSPNILVGDATHGKQYFDAHCASCHSVTGDLAGFAKKVTSPKLLQAAWLRGNHFGVPAPTITVTVSPQGKPVADGTLIHIDDFLVTLKVPDGSMQTFRRNGDVPKVVVKDPLDAHRKLLPTYSDKDIHDVTAYLVTLK